MSRYIDAEIALKIIDSYAKTVIADGKVIVDAVKDIIAVITPTADVVEVVRCKDCIHRKEEIPQCGLYRCTALVHPQAVNADHFCSYGERKKK